MMYINGPVVEKDYEGGPFTIHRRICKIFISLLDESSGLQRNRLNRSMKNVNRIDLPLPLPTPAFPTLPTSFSIFPLN